MIIQSTYIEGYYFHNPELYDDWFISRCVISENSITPVAQLYLDWCAFAEVAGNQLAGSKKSFGQMMRKRGFASVCLMVSEKKCKCYKHISLIVGGSNDVH